MGKERPSAPRSLLAYPVEVTWMRKRDHNVLTNAASLLICGLLAGVVVAALANLGQAPMSTELASRLAAPFIAVSAFFTSYVAFVGDIRATIAVTVSAIAGVVLYASAFVWLGLVSTQAIGVGLLYIVLWEGFFSGFVSGVRLLSIRHYAIGLMHGIDPRRFEGVPHLTLTPAIVMTVLVAGGFLIMSIRRLRRMDVP